MIQNDSNLAKPHNKNFEFAISEWSVLIGQENVILDRSLLEKLSKSCGTRDVFALAVLYPTSTEHVQQIVNVAARWDVPLFPVSRGKNWGYGSTTPTTVDNVIVDLSRMNKILEVNQDLAYAVVEPGVTQAQLFDYLSQNNIELTFDVTGSSTSASLLGNLLERGSGPSRYADHFLNSSGMEIVLGDGSLLKTGFGHIDNAKCTHIYKWGLGPYLDGLFTQSNFGIVTKVGIWLMPKAKNFSVIFSQFDSDRQLAMVIDQLRKLKLSGELPAAIHIANDLRVVSTLQTFPFDSAQSQHSLNESEKNDLRKKWQVGVWNMLASVDGSPAMVKAKIGDMRKSLNKVARIQAFSEKFLSIFEKLPLLAKLIGQRDFKSKLAILRLMKGVPSNAALKGAYWRKAKLPQDFSDPLADRCGIMWCSPMVPMTSKNILEFLVITREIFARFSLDANIGITLLGERYCCCTVGIIFDRDNQQESLRAKDCYAEMMIRLISAGYPPYRLSSDTSAVNKLIFNDQDQFWHVCQKIKNILDPSGIIAPGKYGIY